MKHETDIDDRIEVVNYLNKTSLTDELLEIKQGLESPQKQLSSKYFYDSKGSSLFEEICRLDEYYQTRTELDILKNSVIQSLSNVFNAELIELGAGENVKIKVIIDALSKNKGGKIHYIPIDVSEDALRNNAAELVALFPKVKVNGLLADFTQDISFNLNGFTRIFCFFGSTIGNLDDEASVKLMANIARQMKTDDRFFVGFDRVKNFNIIEAAYNDAKGITARFNKNILSVINNLAGTNFDTEAFSHVSFYNQCESRIEMHLQAKKDMRIFMKSTNTDFFIKKGETIHTENSSKFTHERIAKLGNKANLQLHCLHSDAMEWFSIAEFKL